MYHGQPFISDIYIYFDQYMSAKPCGIGGFVKLQVQQLKIRATEADDLWGNQPNTPEIAGFTLPETNSSHLKKGRPKRKRSYSNHPFSGAKMLVSGRVFSLALLRETSSRLLEVDRTTYSWWFRNPGYINPPGMYKAFLNNGINYFINISWISEPSTVLPFTLNSSDWNIVPSLRSKMVFFWEQLFSDPIMAGQPSEIRV